jgi:hypothetical protein
MFLSNPENAFHFNSGITVVSPSLRVYNKLLKTLRQYESGWDYTDQALFDAALRSVFGLLPA